MKPVSFSVIEQRNVDRAGCVLDQGLPIHPLDPNQVKHLCIKDSASQIVPAGINIESMDYTGHVRWITASFAVDLESGKRMDYTLELDPSYEASNAIQVQESSDSICIKNSEMSVLLTNPGNIRIETKDGLVADGPIDFNLKGDCRSAVGNQRPVSFQPEGYTIVESSSRRVKALLSGRYLARAPKSPEIDKVQRYDVDLELTIYADSNVIRLKWCITDHLRFNCTYMWLDRYYLTFPLARTTGVEGDKSDDSDGCKTWLTASTSGGNISATFPMSHWIGKGAGLRLEQTELGNAIAIGGLNPPVDGGFGGKAPHIWRKFFLGMSRTFEASIIVTSNPGQVESELKPIPIVVDPQHYADCGELPESGGKVTFGHWKDVIDRSGEWLLDNQWNGTLWFGEWWREWDVKNNQGVEETNSGNSALAPVYHFFRTGDWRFWECAKKSYYYTYDLQFCKREGDWGPYMHTRRFLLDHQEWFHPRYQRVGGIVKPSHVFSHKRNRDKTYWMLKFWADRYFDKDGCPQLPERDGTMSRVDERAMAIIGDSMALAYIETGDRKYLETARSVGNWVVESFKAVNWEVIAENVNSTRYILQGLLPLCKLTDDPSYRETFIRISEWTSTADRIGTHFFTFHFHLGAFAYKLSGNRELLVNNLDNAKWVLSTESPENPGTFPFENNHQVPETVWISSYDNIGVVAYLPALASALEEAGIPAE